MGLALPLAGVYLWLGQAPISLARAALMLAFVTMLLFLHRPKVLLDALLAALALLLCLDPFALFDISLQLSALSVAVIALSLPLMQRGVDFFLPGNPAHSRLHAFCVKCLRGCCFMLLISLVIQIVIMPLVLRAFGTVGLWFPLNLLWLPLLGLWTMPLSFAGLFLSSMDFLFLAGVFLKLAALPGDALFALLSFLDAHDLLAAPVTLRPHWLSIAGFWLLCLALPMLLYQWSRIRPAGWVSLGRIALPDNCALMGKAAYFVNRIQRYSVARCINPLGKAALLCLLGAIFLAAPLLKAWQDQAIPGVRLRLLDVGQGQAAVVEWSGLEWKNGLPGPGNLPASGRVLIDGGGFSGASFDVGQSVVAPALTDNALPRLRMVINTHPDTDHLGGLIYILRHFQVNAFVENGDPAPPGLQTPLQEVLSARRIPHRVLVAGDSIPLAPDLELEVLWPVAGRATSGKSSNSASFVLRLVWQGEPLVMLCGDAEAANLRALLSLNKDLRSSVLVLPHHGSSGSLLPAFYEAVNPDLALASCGYGNQWGFPNPAVRGALADRGTPLYTTANSGQILLEWPEPKEKFVLRLGRERETD
jgi:competence protein ComEC